MSGKSVCIVGAGLSGMSSIKECVVKGLVPTCYELDSDLGGIWRPRDDDKSTNSVSLWSNFITNTSKWANAFSDFPPNRTDAPYQSQKEIFQYYESYAKHFDLFRHIQFNTRVIWVQKAPDHVTNGKWEVFTCPTAEFRNGDMSSPTPATKVTEKERDELLSKCKKETYDFVMICSGYFKYPHSPDVPGASTFKGTIQHSFTYTTPKVFEDKNVLVVGNKFSATDITDDIGAMAKQAYLAVGEGTWIMPRVYPGGRTVEQLITRDLIYHRNSAQKWNEHIVNSAQNRLDHNALGIRPKMEPFLAPRGYGDGLCVKIMSGRVKLFGRLTKFTENEAHFKDGSVIPHLDSVIFCTGYGVDLSFLDSEVLASNGRMDLYKMVFPVNEEKHTLSFIGVLGCDSPMAIVCEIQARLATQVMTGQHVLPSKKEMAKDANHWNDMNWRLKKSYRYYLPGFELMDSIASVLGVYPSVWKIALRDPLLAYRVWYGSIVGAHYRLVGSDNQWEEARKFSHQQYEERANCLRNINITPASECSDTTMKTSSLKPWFKLISLSAAATCALALAFRQNSLPVMFTNITLYRA